MSADKTSLVMITIAVSLTAILTAIADSKAAVASLEETQALAEGRQSHMREHAVAFYNLAKYLKAGKPHSPDALLYAEQFLVNTKEMDQYFAPGTGPKPGVTTAARPEIWQRPEEFRRFREVLAREAEKLVAAVQAEDLGKAQHQYNVTGAVCNACHAHFRAEQRVERVP